MFEVEGTGSYGAGLASAIRRRSIGVLEVLHTGLSHLISP
jgi:transposase